ncbi:lysylphosphatidylglycerol synthase transmembrane domain-containing protein [Atopobiaceae bacterium 24-176]
MATDSQKGTQASTPPDVLDFRTKGEAVAALQAFEDGKPVSKEEGAVRKKGSKPDRKGIIVGSLFMAAVFASLIVYIVRTGQQATLADALSRVQVPWVAATFAIMVAYLVFGTLAFVTTVVVTPDAPAGALDLCSVEAAGTLFGNLTPMMAGSVPGQIWRLLKSGLGFGAASAVQITRFLMFQLSELVLGGMLLALTWDYFYARVGAVLVLNLVVFALKAAQMAVLLAACLFPSWVTKVALAALGFVDRHRLFGLQGRTDGWRSVVKTQVGQFSSAFQCAVRHRGAMLVMLGFSIAQQACLWVSPWFVLKAFGLGEGLLVVCAAGSLVQFMASSIPLPGGTGGVEASFALFLGPLFGSAATAGYLVWRLVTYYGYTAICGAVTMASTKPSSPTVRQRMRGLVERVDS